MKRIKYKWGNKGCRGKYWVISNYVDIYAETETLEIIKETLLGLSSVLSYMNAKNEKSLEPSLRVFVSVRAERSDIREINRILKERF